VIRLQLLDPPACFILRCCSSYSLFTCGVCWVLHAVGCSVAALGRCDASCLAGTCCRWAHCNSRMLFLACVCCHHSLSPGPSTPACGGLFYTTVLSAYVLQLPSAPSTMYNLADIDVTSRGCLFRATVLLGMRCLDCQVGCNCSSESNPVVLVMAAVMAVATTDTHCDV
jgi:hypothetical protein